MSELKAEKEIGTIAAAEATPENTRRDFMKKYGTYAAGSAVGLFILMSPKTSKALGSDGSP